MRIHSTFTKALAVSAVALMSLTACGGSDSGDADSSAGGNELGLVQPGTLTICSDVPYPPFEFEKDGDYTGFDIDLMRAISDSMGLELAVQDVGFDGLQSGVVLASGQCDVGASAMTITEDRKEHLGFTDGYYDSEQSLLVPKDSDIKSIEDLAGKTVGVQQGTTGENYTRENVPSDTEVKAYPSDAELFPALKSKGVDAVLQDLPVNLGHQEDGQYVIVEKYKTDEQYGFAVNKEGSEALLKELDAKLAELKDNGKYQEIYDKYFSTK
ncbi:transporter substrate-binding domain-containing protein [Arthrobacter sp. JSM 101049]|uniref:basic amino acid ABC transporter substrate-binding protein n=1 Tax=Arthrobacter sp. JSM 101049 TaxID=929097 RepID=UPI0035668B0B